MKNSNPYRNILVALFINFAFIVQANETTKNIIFPPAAIQSNHELEKESSPVNIFSVSAVFAIAIVGYRFRKKII